MPKTLTGAELQLDDAPARESELFLVDGNNLAYRAYFALPEELATTDGFPTNALLGFRAAVRHLPGEATTIAVLTNQSRADPGVIVNDLLSIVFAPEPPCFRCKDPT